ncbi:hypothetical protein FB192DRAFT_1467139 [Mucor lusitanicus]|uniref:Uncharacterized protein n=1 Tax=Mucor circinelloides f. lusitanicus TaxID=29924 RepID=A0A8H4B609_MUCCL|nr:hypothetical protein FB192DRAFT_1467139 [Mucor lusitanicus]
MDGVSLSSLCFQFFKACTKIPTISDAAELSDVRVLAALNHVCLFDKDGDLPVTKYFPSDVALMLLPMYSTQVHHVLPDGIDCHSGCRLLETSPPHDYMSSMLMCSKFFTAACTSQNCCDTHHTAQVLTQVSPLLIHGPRDKSDEDSHVH